MTTKTTADDGCEDSIKVTVAKEDEHALNMIGMSVCELDEDKGILHIELKQTEDGKKDDTVAPESYRHTS